MQWYDYLKKAPVAQIVADWREYRKLRAVLKKAKKDMVVSVLPLVRYYGVGEDIGVGNACIKSKRLVDGFELFDETPCAFDVRRCSDFAPERAEKKCPNNLCVMWRDNNRYCDNRQKYNDLQVIYKQFLAKRFARVK